jgi:hypothetical protein
VRLQWPGAAELSCPFAELVPADREETVDVSYLTDTEAHLFCRDGSCDPARKASLRAQLATARFSLPQEVRRSDTAGHSRYLYEL